jgi:hypothetical protein
MAWISKYHPTVIVDPTDPEQPGAAVISSEPAVSTSGVLAYTYLGWADRPMRVDPTGTTVQPVTVVGGGGINSSVGPTGSPVPASATFVAAKDIGGNLAGLLVDGTGALKVTGGSSGSQYTNGQAVVSGSLVGTAALGYDGTNVRVIKTDSTGAIFITGSISATNPSVGTNDAAAPASSTQIGVFDGVDLRAVRTPNIFKTLSTTGVSAPKPIWTPAAGKKFRLMRLSVSVSGNAYITAGGMLTLYFSEGPAGSDIGYDFNLWIPPLMGNGANSYNFTATLFDSGLVDLGNGYLAAAINTTLYVQMNQVLNGGLVTVNVMGTEE